MTSTYAESPLPGFEHLVRCRWVSTTDSIPFDDEPAAELSAGAPAVRRIVPDGCADIHVDQDGDARVIGTMTNAVSAAPARAGDRIWALRLRPEAARAVLGVPAHELLDQTIPLESVLARQAAAGLARFVVDPSHPGPGDDRLLRDATIDPAMARAADLLWGTAAVDVGTVAAQAWLSSRHLRRRAQDEVGIGPKLLQRIGRLHRFLDLLDRSIRSGGPGPGPAPLALAAGYADQAHANRDVLALTGATPGQLATERRAATPIATATPIG